MRFISSSLKYPYKRTISAPAGMGLSVASKATLQHSAHHRSHHSHGGGSTPYSRQQSMPLMMRSGTHRYRNPGQLDMGGAGGAGGAGGSGGIGIGGPGGGVGAGRQTSALGAAFGMASASGDAGAADGITEYVNVAAKTLDMDEIDKETLHLLVFLFMQFLSTPEQVIWQNNLPTFFSSKCFSPFRKTGRSPSSR